MFPIQLLRPTVVDKRDPSTVRQLAVKIVPSTIPTFSQVEVKPLVKTGCASKRITGRYFKDIVREKVNE
jgi:hypothetical protein